MARITQFLFCMQKVMPLLAAALSACDTLTTEICGELSGDHKAYVVRVNYAYKSRLQVQQVPCYPGYLQVKCWSTVSSKTLDSIEVSASTLGWMEVLVYNHQGDLVRGNTGSM